MKEATGELNMTVVTVVAIAAIGALFTVFLWPRIRANIILSTACSNVNANGTYHEDNGDGNSVDCNEWLCTANYQGRNYERNCRDN